MDVQKNHQALLKTAGCSLLVGTLFYLLFRSPVLGLAPFLTTSVIQDHVLLSELVGSLPSVIFMPLIISLTLLLVYWKKKLSQTIVNKVTVNWLLIVVFFEICQGQQMGVLSRGTFSVSDIIAASIASLVTGLLLSRYLVISKASSTSNEINIWKKASILLLGSFAILGSAYEDNYVSDCEGDNSYYLCVSEVVLDLDELRLEIQPDYSGNQVLERSGKIYQLDQWLFVVEKYRGIHIFDMSDKLNPIRQVYLPIVGALNLTIKDGILYSSAFIDLVIIDLNGLLQNDGSELSVVRQEGIFQYPEERQFFPDGYWMNYYDEYNSTINIVIGYKTKSGKDILYGDEYDFKNQEFDANERSIKKAEENENKNKNVEVDLDDVFDCLLFGGMC